MKKRVVVKDKKIMADHVALGVENWPEDVGEEIARLREKYYIPDEEKIICAIDGSRIVTLQDVVNGNLSCSEQMEDCCQRNDEVIISVCSCAAQAENKIGGAYPAESTDEDDDDERLDTLVKIQNYYRFMYPWLFIDRAPAVKKRKKLKLKKTSCPKFHGATRHNHPKPQVVRLHGKANAKKRPCKCRCRKTIRQEA